MRRTALLAALVVALAAIAVACVPQPQPPPNPVCQAQAAPGAPPTSASPVSLTPVNAMTSLGQTITMATRTSPSDPTLYVGTLAGRIYAVTGSGAPPLVLDFSSLVGSGGELGFLGMTFSPDGTKLYVHYSGAGGTTTVDEYTASASIPAVVTDASRRTVLTAPGLETNHNGGSLLFGPDGLLYLATGDGGGGNDQYPNYSSHTAGGNGQNIDTLLGKVLRIDPTDPGAPGGGPALGQSYSVPTDPTTGNPFVGVAGADEVWSFGLRNPFRMSFDKTTGDLWIGDVGQGAREEINFVAADDATHPRGRKANFGWNRCEGKTAGPDPTPPNGAGGAVVHPIFDIGRAQGDCAIIGGYVYRGSAIPSLAGKYVYSDNCNGKIRALTRSGLTATNEYLGQTASQPSSFGEDNDGELYVLTLGQGVFKVTP